MKEWFTLFFIPIFPFNTIETFYHCKHCNASYKESAREALLGSLENKQKIEKEAKRLFGKTLIACMTHMANIDGEISPSELEEINKIKDNFSDFSNETEKVFEDVKNSENPEEFVYSLLRQSLETLTSEAIMSIIGLSAKVLLADGRIDEEEEKLLKEYLLVCGIPKHMYKTVIEKAK